MGAVYEALDEAVGETVALKLLEAPDAEALDRFRREVKLARRITHPNVARIHDLGQHGDVHFLTMEYVPGASLRAAMTGAWPPAQAATVAHVVAQALAAAHAVGVVHRDLKPENRRAVSS
jgi:serine/threonine-protein kinase